jgi:hypothetical protein
VHFKCQLQTSAANVGTMRTLTPHCALHAESLRALCSQLAELEVKSAGAPLVSIATGDAPAAAEWQHESSSSSSGAGKGEDWELL